MKIIFFGSSKFAVESLKILLESEHDILCVVTQPDREQGRGMHLGKTPVKTFANDKQIRIFQPYKKDLKNEIELLSGFNADIFVVVAYGLILPKEIIELPKIFSINLHGSLLPAYRGAAPINWAIINNEKETGVTVIKLTEEMDAGPIIQNRKITIEQADNAHTLEEKLSKAGAKLLLDTINNIAINKYKLTGQDENKITYAPKLIKQNGLIDWEDNAQSIINLIRGCFGWPGAFTYYNGKLIKILRAESSKIAVHEYQPGQICEIDKNGIHVVVAGGSIVIRELQPEGKKSMSCADFISGHKLIKGNSFLKSSF
ncbi:MAG: methionyl-tRNA formyltransferase [Candidatus Omnitrophota bacterium]